MKLALRAVVGPVLSRYGAVLLQFVTMALIAQRLPTDEAGQYILLLGLVQTLYLLTGFGLPDGLVPASAQVQRSAGAAPTLTRLLLVCLASLATICLALFIGLGVFSGGVFLAGAASLWLAGHGWIFVVSQALVSKGRAQAGTFVFYTSANLMGVATILPYLLFADNPTLTGAVVASLLSTFVAAGSATFYLWRVGHSDDSGVASRVCAPLRECFKAGIPISFARFIQSVIVWMPVWVASVLLGAEEAATLGIASRVAAGAGAALAAVRFSIRHTLAGLVADQAWPAIRRSNRSVANLAFTVAILGIVGAALFGPQVLSRIFGEVYAASALPLTIMLVGLAGESFGGAVDEVIKMAGRGWVVVGAQTVSLLMSSFLYFGVGQMGVWAIACTYAFSMVCTYGLLLAYVYRRQRIWLGLSVFLSRSRESEGLTDYLAPKPQGAQGGAK